MNPKWHVDDIETVRKKLNADTENGLSRKAARLRLSKEERGSPERYGSFFVREKRSAFECFFQMLRAPAALLLLTASIVLILLGDRLTGALSLVLLLVGCAVSGILYLRTQRIMQTMSLYSNPTVRVLREGKIYLTDCRNVVAGDIIDFSKGDYIPCDGRLIYSDMLELEEYIKTDGGKIVKRRAKKNYAAVCGEETQICDSPNAVLSGSFVLYGKGRAIAVGTGAHTYAYGFLKNGSLCAKSADSNSVKETGRLLKGISLLVFIVAAALAVISLFTVRDGDVRDVIFLALSTVCAFTLISAQTVGRVLCSSYCEKASSPANSVNMAVIKNNSAIDCFLNVTDIVLLGRTGITDGKCHMGEMAVPEYIMGENVADSRINGMLRYLYVYITAASDGTHGELEFIRDGYAAGISHYMENKRFDREKAELCLKSLYFMEDDYKYACAEWQDEMFRVCLSSDRKILDKCAFVRIGNLAAAMSEKFLSAVYGYINEKRASGRKLIYVVSEHDGEKIFEGIADFYEQVPSLNSENIRELRERGIAVTLLLGEESIENLNYVITAGILEGQGMQTVARASDFRRQNRDILENSDKYKVFMGFEPEDYEKLVKNMKEDGKTVVAYGVEDKYFYVYGGADIYVSCDNINYSSLKFKESVIENPSSEGIESSKRCSQRTKAYASVLVRRADDRGGGLAGILNAMNTSEYFEVCFRYAMLCIAVIDITLLSLSALSLLSGFLLLTYPCVLLGAVVFLFAVPALFSIFGPVRTVSVKSGDKTDFFEFFKANAEFLFAPVCAAFSLLAAVVVMYATGMSNETNAAASGFLSMTITLIVSILSIVKKSTGQKVSAVSRLKLKKTQKKSKNFSGNFLYAAVLFVLLGLFVLTAVTGAAVPSLAEEFGFNGLGFHTLIEISVYIAVWFLSWAAVKKIVKRRNKK